MSTIGPTSKRLEVGHAALAEAVAEATRTSERAILGVGDRLGTIVSGVVDLTADLARVREHVAGFDIDQDLGDDFARAYLEDFRRHLDDAAPLVEEFGTQTSGLLELLDDLDQIATTSALLAVTARIETGRLQDRGVAGVVQDLDALNDEVRRVGEQIGANTRDLGEALRELVALRDELDAEASGFARRLGGTARELYRELAAMRESVEAHIEGRGERVKQVLFHAREALSHLQYQDPMVQDLQRIDVILAEARNAVDAAHGGPGGATPLMYTSNLGDRIDDGHDAGSDEDVAVPGGVLLF